MDKKPLMDVLQQTRELINEILKEDDFYVIEMNLEAVETWIDILEKCENRDDVSELYDIIKEDFYYTYSDELTSGPLDEKRVDLIARCLDLADLLQRSK